MSENVTVTVDVTAVPGTEATTAHFQTRTVHIRQYVPYHPTRVDDPYYRLFDQARARMKRLGLLKCAVAGCTAPESEIEAHHTLCEFSMSNGVDIAKFEALHPDLHVESDDDFQRFVEGQGNLTPYCKLHHTGDLGVHVLDGPMFELLPVWKDGLPLPAERVTITAQSAGTGGTTVEVNAGDASVTVDSAGAPAFAPGDSVLDPAMLRPDEEDAATVAAMKAGD